MEEKVTKFAQQFISNQTAEWKSKYCEYGLLSRMMHILKERNIEYKPLLTCDEIPKITEGQVLDKLRSELTKVSEFYKFKLEEYLERFEKLQIMGAFVCNLTAFQETFQNKKPDNVSFFIHYYVIIINPFNTIRFY